MRTELWLAMEQAKARSQEAEMVRFGYDCHSNLSPEGAFRYFVSKVYRGSFSRIIICKLSDSSKKSSPRSENSARPNRQVISLQE